MPWLEYIFFGNTAFTWLLSGGLTALTLAALFVLKRYVLQRLRRLAASTATTFDDLFVEVLAGTRSFTMLAAALYLGASLLSLPDQTARILSRAFVVLLFLQGALWGNAAIGFSRNILAARRDGQDPAGAAAFGAMTFVARLLLWGLAALLVLDNLGVNITGLVAGLGIGGIAVALALQNILGDLFASLSILLDKPFVVGDFVVVDAHLGTIEHIGLKTTRVRSLSGEQIVISNADLLSSRIRNFKRMTERRVVLSIGVTYQTSPPKLATAAAIIRESIGEQEGTRLDRVHFKEFGASALCFEAVYFVLDPDYNHFMDVQQAVNLRIFERFAEEKIEFAYPTQTLFVQESAHDGTNHGEAKEAPGDQPRGAEGARQETRKEGS
jgi:small-conductance mechanosensitive channel